MARLKGGFGETELATPEVQEICNKIKPEVEQKEGQNFATFTAVECRKQLVNGYNLLIKVFVGCDAYIHLKLYQAFEGALTLSGYQMCKEKDEPLTVF